MKRLKLIQIVFYIALFVVELNAQSETGANQLLNDGNGRPLYLKSNYTGEGSPFLYDEYLPAALLATNGKLYTNVMVKLNVVENELYYQLPDGQQMISTTPVNKVYFLKASMGETAFDSLIVTSASGPVNSKGSGIYVVCSQGKSTLLKKVQITFKDLQEYGNTNIVRSFRRKEILMIQQKNGMIVPLIKDEDTILNLMKDQRARVKKFVTENKLNLKKDDDILTVFTFYNSLT